jgi:pyruvate formate lyase activating enzyme
MGIIFDIKQYAIHDGPGIRTTVFLKGCPLTCVWCHNPEGIAKEPEFMWSQEKCIHCKTCVCPKDALSFNHVLQIDDQKCTVCSACSDACPSQALALLGKEMSVAHVVKEIEKDIPFYDESNGGVTISGGEPLMQPDFLYALLKACKARNIHTAVDTSGYAPFDILSKVKKYTDLFLYDIKGINDDTHKKVTGVSNTLILKNVKALSRITDIIVRYPLIPGINDSKTDIAAFTEFVSSIPVDEVDILPYHTTGKKAKKLKKAVFITDPPAAETIEDMRKMLKRTGITVKIGG